MRRVLLAVLAAVVPAGCGKKVAQNAAPEVAPPPVVIQPAVVPVEQAPAKDELRAEAQPVADAQTRMAALGRVMTDLRDATGLMPSVERTLAEIKRHPDLLAAVGKGSVILTGTADPAGLWAFAAGAEATGGAVLVGGKAATATAAEVRRYLAPGRSPAPAPAVVAQAPPPAPKAKLENPPAPKPKPPAPAATTPPAANVVVGRQDMDDVRLLIDTASLAGGRMPSTAFVQTALTDAGSPAAELVKTKAIVLTGVPTREGVWAYEAAAATRGGLVAGPGGVETVTADELKRRLGPQ